MKILEIPPYRKNQLKNNLVAANPSTSSSTMGLTTRVPEIPAYRPRKTSEHSSIESTSYGDQNQPSSTQGCPEWMRRLKPNNASTIHRSVDCIPSKEETIIVDANPMDVTPSWINLTDKRESVSNANLSTKKSPDEDTKGKLFCDFLPNSTMNFELFQLLNQLLKSPV